MLQKNQNNNNKIQTKTITTTPQKIENPIRLVIMLLIIFFKNSMIFKMHVCLKRFFPVTT